MLSLNLNRLRYFATIAGLFVFGIPTGQEPLRNQWIIWNVGQGQWITHVENKICWHFDFGGERNPILEVKKFCRLRENRLVLSHGDRDHFNFMPSIMKAMPSSCLWGPSWDLDTLRKKISLKNGEQAPKRCRSEGLDSLETFLPEASPHQQSNDQSQFTDVNHWLFTGDAPQRMELQWIKNTDKRRLKTIFYLVLGHHGSRTSTSPLLLRRLSNLRMCFASSRKKRYGHPHKEVIDRVRGHCPILKTEVWNHIHILDEN